MVCAKAKPGAKIIYGLKPGITRQRFTEALNSGKLEECLNEVEVRPGDVYPVEAGVVHALGAGIIVAEFQQNSDLTYRVYDWRRLDDCGRPRPLHIDRALQVIDFSGPPTQGGSGVARSTGEGNYSTEVGTLLWRPSGLLGKK